MRPAKPKAYVTYVADSQTVPVGRRGVLELRFHVMTGFHVNSHTPKSPLLIPTALTLQPADGVKADALEYPAGKVYSFSFDPGDKLDVYAGDFTVKLPVVAARGRAYGGGNAEVSGVRQRIVLSAEDDAGEGGVYGEMKASSERCTGPVAWRRGHTRRWLNGDCGVLKDHRDGHGRV
jgi:hypothetical protein